MREAGDVCYADTYKDGTGMVEFLRYEDMKYAIRKLDDSKFRSHEVSALTISTKIYLIATFAQGEVSYVRVKEDTGDGKLSSVCFFQLYNTVCRRPWKWS